jgi:glycosyltransferase involved in cell wall biosynthesis
MMPFADVDWRRFRKLAVRVSPNLVGRLIKLRREWQLPIPELAPPGRSPFSRSVRADSGTRIKILEAFSFRRPVVSTHLGAAGLAVTPGEHLLLADEPEAMAQACLTMLNDREHRDRMVGSAWQWVLDNHSIANVEAAMDLIHPR